jgi:hypothetical protein
MYLLPGLYVVARGGGEHDLSAMRELELQDVLLSRSRPPRLHVRLCVFGWVCLCVYLCVGVCLYVYVCVRACVEPYCMSLLLVCV